MKWAIMRVLFAGCTAVSAVAQADVASARSKVTTLEQVWAGALTAGDLKVLDALADPEIIYVDPDGTLLTKAELLSQGKAGHLKRTIARIVKVLVFDDTAVVNGRYESKEVTNGRTLTQDGQFTDTWLYRDSNWVCIVAQATPELGSTR